MIAEITHVPFAAVQFDSVTQIRAEIKTDLVDEYAEAMAAGEAFPPVQLFSDKITKGAKYWIGDGWHRMLAHQTNGDATIPAVVHIGGRDAAIKYALSANARHGLKRTNADKQKAVRVALKEFPTLSDRAIGKLCAVTHPTVAAARSQVEKFTTSDTRTGIDGKSYPATQPAKPPQNDVWEFTPEERAAALAERAAATENQPVATVAVIAPPLAPPPAPAAAVIERQPLLRPSASAGAFDSASWKARVIAANTAFLREVPAKHRATAAEFIATQAKQILEVL